MPHCCDEVQVFEPGGTLRQVPETQNWPVLQSLLPVQEGWQRPLVQASFALQSFVVVQVWRGSQLPF